MAQNITRILFHSIPDETLFFIFALPKISENCTKAAVFSEGTVKYCLPPAQLFRLGGELAALGLDIPLTAKLCAALEEQGVKLDCDFTTEDCIAKILALRGDKA